jgi:hypothetical protein
VGPLREMLATDHRQALEFFTQRLQDVSGPGVDPQELLYNASVLAHDAQVSTQAVLEISADADLGKIFDRFVVDSRLWHDGLMMEAAGARCLVLAGFFEDQMRRRYNIRWYSQLGATFLRQAAAHEASPHKARLLEVVATRFETWRRRHARLARDLRDQALLLTPRK